MERSDRWITMADGVRLHATLWLPTDARRRPVACLLEALPYRKDDVTANYADTYLDLVDRGGFGVCRLDLRGTGSSGGIATDEYPETEIDDLAAVIAALAAEPWCTGKVGMFGTSYSGFNSLHAAAAGIAELGAVCAVYSSDDRFTDDVHFIGGALRALDVVDYVTYMVAMNALPPVPAIWGDGWDEEWSRRIDATPPWLFGWIASQTDGPDWRRGSIRLGPGGEGYERISCPTMLVGGWADGYRNNTFRTVAALHVPWRLLLGPWAHAAPEHARPGPNLDLVTEMIGWFDEHLRGGPARHPHPVQVFVREWTPPEPDQPLHAGRWRHEAGWPLARAGVHELALGEGVVRLAVRPDVGLAAWNSCAGSLPWGQPLDQRADDAWSITTDWPMDEAVELLGHARLDLRVRSSAPVAHVAAKLCAVGPDGASVLITRGYLNLSHRDCWPVAVAGQASAPEAVQVGEWYDVTVELEATSWVLRAGDRLRLSLAGTDWPNAWPPPEPLVLDFDRAGSRLALPVVPPQPEPLPTPTFAAVERVRAASGDEVEGDDEADDVPVRWSVEHDVLARRTRAVTRYGGVATGTGGAVVVDRYDGMVEVSTRDPGDAVAEGRASYEITWPEATCGTRCVVRVASDANAYHVTTELVADRDGHRVAERRWAESIPRRLQ